MVSLDGRQSLITEGLVAQRREFEFDSKHNGKLVKEFKRNNTGLD